ncbi:MAG: hypothetical protein AAFO94_12450, partial [Bacteroidota bacterium]
MHGPKAQSRVGAIPKPATIDFTGISEGEAALRILLRRMEILKRVRPEKRGVYELGAEIIQENLHAGLHSFNNLYGDTSVPELRNITQEIQRAKLLSLPAMYRSKSRINGVDEDCRDEILTSGIKETIPNPFRKWYNPFLPKNISNPAFIEAFAKCKRAKSWAQTLNNRLEDSSYFLLYENAFDANEYPTVATKKLSHTVCINLFAQESGIPRSQVAAIVENGILANGINKSGRETYITFRDGAIEPRIGEPVTVAAIITIVKVVAAIIPAIAVTAPATTFTIVMMA